MNTTVGAPEQVYTIDNNSNISVSYICCDCRQVVVLRAGDAVICKNIHPTTGKKCYATQVMKQRIGWSYGTCR